MSTEPALPTIIPPGATRVILSSRDLQKFVLSRTTDARSAMAQGIGEYLQQLSETVDGALVSIKRAFSEWAEPEDDAEYPAVAIWTEEPGMYVEGNFAPGIREDMRIEGTKVYLKISKELQQTFMLDVWCTGVDERGLVVGMIEDAFAPVEWMSGVRLELPHYFNVRCDFDIVSVNYMDDQDSARRRFRKAEIKITGSIPVIRAHGPTNVWSIKGTQSNVPGIVIPEAATEVDVIVKVEDTTVGKVVLKGPG